MTFPNPFSESLSFLPESLADKRGLDGTIDIISSLFAGTGEFEVNVVTCPLGRPLHDGHLRRGRGRRWRLRLTAAVCGLGGNRRQDSRMS